MYKYVCVLNSIIFPACVQLAKLVEATTWVCIVYQHAVQLNAANWFPIGYANGTIGPKKALKS